MSHPADPHEPSRSNPPESPPSSPHLTPIASEDPTLTAERASPGTGGSFEIPPPGLGVELPDFELLEIIGRGGMGVVYKARQKSLDRLVAIKMLVGDHGQSGLALTRFRAEARAAAALDHPNIVGIHQVGECVLGHYFAMEYIEGQTLQQVLDKQFSGKNVPVARAVSLMVAVTGAVAYAHGKGIVHRDLKPGNIMIDKFRRPVVMDFGLAKVVGKSANLTGRGVIMGTPTYIPPEQTGECGGQVGPHSDVYSLGAILYRLLAGRVVYEAETMLRTIMLVVGPDVPPPVSQLRPEVPVPLSDLCMKCLSKRAEDRYPDAAALAKELRWFKSAEQSSASGTRLTLPPIVLVPAKTGNPIPLTGATTLIGRASDCQVVLKSAEVSKRHCRIRVQDERAELEDLDSVNGTILNGEPIRRSFLKDGDVIELGDHSFSVKLNKPLR